MNWIKKLFAKKMPFAKQQPLINNKIVSPLKNLNIASEALAYKFTDATTRIAAFGDIHGRVDLLLRLAPALDRLAEDTERSLIEIYLGDYVDRGANSKGVIDYLIARNSLTNRKIICLAGNHEQMMVAALNNDDEFKKWLDFGGQSTLLSYGVSPNHASKDISRKRAEFIKAIPQNHIDFLQTLPTSYHHAEFYFAHAGIHPKKPLSAQKDEDLLWIRNPFLNSFADFGVTVVHGHTPGQKPVFRPNRIGIDTGAYRTGVLTCLVITSKKISVIDTGQQGLKEL